MLKRRKRRAPTVSEPGLRLLRFGENEKSGAEREGHATLAAN